MGVLEDNLLIIGMCLSFSAAAGWRWIHEGFLRRL